MIIEIKINLICTYISSSSGLMICLVISVVAVMSEAARSGRPIALRSVPTTGRSLHGHLRLGRCHTH